MSEGAPIAETERPSPGHALAAARAELRLSVADVSQQIKYGVKQIAAIEADDYAKLPGTTFVRGMIRSYAKLLQIDSAPLLAELGRRGIPGAPTVDLRTSEQEPFFEGGGKSNRIYVWLSVAALVAVAMVAYEWWINPLDTGEVVTITPRAGPEEGNAAAVPAASPAPAPADVPPAPTDAPEPAAAKEAHADKRPVRIATSAVADKAGVSAGKRIELDFAQLSWVEIKQSNGRILLSQLNPAGTRRVIEGEPPFDVVIGNAANVRLMYNDEAVDLRPYFKVDVARLKLE